MNSPELIATIFSAITLIPTLASLTKFDQWWVRAFDFPRLQISFLVLLALILCFFIYDFSSTWHFLVIFLLAGSFIYQGVKIYPYTILAKKQVFKFVENNKENCISVLVSNVLTTNTKYHRLLKRIEDKDPDIILTLETDLKWEKELAVLESEYPYTVKIPQDNLYGMHLYSRLKLEAVEVKYLISEEIPSIHGYVRLRNGKRVKIHCLHPKPPSPTEDSTSTNRDAELLMVGKSLDPKKEPIMVFGDLNDVAWSRTTRLFQQISGLLDPRIGRGFFNTFHTKIFILRWPLDHIFHSGDFTLVELKRLRNIGSDHFPIFVKLNYEPRAEPAQEKPEAPNEEEQQWTDEKIEKGHPIDRLVQR